jgi:enoyl-CoA hydratase/carnithine racemase
MDWATRTTDAITVEERAPGVVLVTLDRPESLNALTFGMFDELGSLVRDLGQDDDVRVVILTGAGRAFCAGFDLSLSDALPAAGPLGMLHIQERAARALLDLRALRVPVIAAVNGAAAGGGLSLALAADIRIASTTARMNAAFVRVGLSAGDLGASWALTRLIGPARTAELCFTGRFVDASEAERIGLVNAVSDPDALIDDALAMAAAITANSPGGVQLSKRALQANQEAASYAAAIELENRGQALLSRTDDMLEAITAFKEKRAPKFVGN